MIHRLCALIALICALVGIFGAFETLYWAPLESVDAWQALALVLGPFTAGMLFVSAARKLLSPV